MSWETLNNARNKRTENTCLALESLGYPRRCYKYLIDECSHYTVFRNTIYFIWKLDLAPINLFIDTVVGKTVYNHDNFMMHKLWIMQECYVSGSKILLNFTPVKCDCNLPCSKSFLRWDESLNLFFLTIWFCFSDDKINRVGSPLLGTHLWSQ